jgi:hypothetical protein
MRDNLLHKDCGAHLILWSEMTMLGLHCTRETSMALTSSAASAGVA